MTRRTLAGLVPVAVGGLALLAQPAAAAPTTFSTTGGVQTYTVPAGVHRIHADAIGGRGGGGSINRPGLGASASADLPVTPGQTLHIFVAGNGANGATPRAATTAAARPPATAAARPAAARPTSGPTRAISTTRILVAAGGGGGGALAAGGNAGAAGANDYGHGHGGGAGTAVAGGGGGWSSVGGNGAAGVLGQGGQAGLYFYPPYQGAGGGGGGYYGGGGGGSFAGGGGGSSFFAAGALNAALTISGATPTVSIDAITTLAGDQGALAFPATPTQSTSAPKALQLTNSGTDDLRITGTDFDYAGGAKGDDYLVGSNTCGGTLSSGESCLVRVRFNPQGTGASSSALIVSTVDAAGDRAPNLRIPVSGTGTGLPQGPAGTNGTNGAAGATGATGAAGTDGIDGANGTDGTNGVNGTDGVNGAAGANGVDGVDGTNGVDGKDGPTGSQGLKGDKGEKGDPATAARVVKEGSSIKNRRLTLRVTCGDLRATENRVMVRTKAGRLLGQRIFTCAAASSKTVTVKLTGRAGEKVSIKIRTRVNGSVPSTSARSLRVA